MSANVRPVHAWPFRGDDGGPLAVPDLHERETPGELPDRLLLEVLESRDLPHDVFQALDADPFSDPLRDPLTAGLSWVLKEGARVQAFGRFGSAPLVHDVEVWLEQQGCGFALEALDVVNTWHVEISTFPRGNPKPPKLVERSGFIIATGARECKALWRQARHRLAECSEDAWASALAEASALRGRDISTDWLTSVLFPSQHAWVEADLRALADRPKDQTARHGLGCAITSLDQLDLFTAACRTMLWLTPEVLDTLSWTLGDQLAPHLAWWIDGRVTERRKSTHSEHDTEVLITAMEALGSDAALAALIEVGDNKAVGEPLREWIFSRPRQGARVLAELLGAMPATERVGSRPARLARALLVRQPESVAAVAKAEEHVGHVFAELVEDSTRDPAPVDLLPAILIDPPWDKRTKPPQVRVELEPLPFQRPIDWGPDGSSSLVGDDDEGMPEERFSEYSDKEYFRSPSSNGFQQLLREGNRKQILVGLTAVEQTGPMVDVLEARWVESTARLLLERVGDDVLPILVGLASRHLQKVAGILPFLNDAALALPLAEQFSRRKALAGEARRWLLAHPEAAAFGLIPHALGPGRARGDATSALLCVAHSSAAARQAIDQAAQQYGAAASEAIAELLSQDLAQQLPTKMPVLPSFINLEAIAPPWLIGRQHALAGEPLRNMLLMLAISGPGLPYVGAVEATDLLDEASAAEFGWELFEAWRVAGSPAEHLWILHAQARLGNAETVRRLAPIIAEWPSQKASARAKHGLATIADFETDYALTYLARLADTVKSKALRAHAGNLLRDLARLRGLTRAQLEDRIVPTCGLDDADSLELSYGPRSVTVTFSEYLVPLIRDDQGKLRKSLPRVRSEDDPELVAAAKKRFSALKKDVKKIATEHIEHLENAMTASRRWTVPEFQNFFVDHPLTQHLTRRILWGVYGEPGVPPTPFRVAEDATLSDERDAAFELNAESTIGIVHPCDLSAEALGAWRTLFSDYELGQPFDQIARLVSQLTDDDRASDDLTRFVGLETSFGLLINLGRRGWTVSGRDAKKPVSNGTSVVVRFKEPMGSPMYAPSGGVAVHSLAAVRVQSKTKQWLNFATLSDIEASELLLDMNYLFG